MVQDSKMPHCIEAEEIVLGSIMSRNAYHEVYDVIDIDVFYSPTNREIFSAIKSIIDKGDSPDRITVSSKVPSELMASVFTISMQSSFDVRQHALLVKEKYMLRRVIEMANKMLVGAYAENDIDVLISETNDEITSLFDNTNADIVTMKDALSQMRSVMNKNASDVSMLTGLPTGFSRIDEKGGLQKGDLVVIAAESSQGKTSLALSMVNFMAKNKHKIAFYSLEMMAVQLASRLTAMESGISSSNILYSKLNENQFVHIDKSLSKIANNSIYIDEKSTLSIDTILSSIRSMKSKYDIECVVVDYIQIIPQNEKGKSEEQILASIARRLKNIAKELNICVIAISQLNRELNAGEPTLARLRGSGQINEAADVTMLIYRPEVVGKTYTNEFASVDVKDTALINIAKGRNIGIFKFISGFHAPTTHFYELDDIPAYKNEIYEPF
jgi:replicative DNA helicase